MRINLGFLQRWFEVLFKYAGKKILKRLCCVGDNRFSLYIIVWLTIMNTSVHMKNSPIRGWGGLSKMSKKMSIIELSRLGPDLFDFSDLT